MKKIDDFLSFLLLEKGENILHNNIPKRAIISEVGERVGFFDDKFIRCDFELNTGDIIEYQSTKWLITSEINKDRKSNRARIRKTNYSVNIVINKRVEVLDCIFSSYNNKLDIDKLLTTLGDAIQVTVPESAFTNDIKLSFRFIKFGRAWQIIGKDYTQKGLITFTCKTDLINAVTDDVINEIANKDLIVDQSVIDTQDLVTITNLANTVTFTQTELSDNLVLPSLVAEGVAVTWMSSNTLNLSNTGVVTRPLVSEPNQQATMTLTLTKGTQVITKTFTFTILAETPTAPTLPDLFTIEITGLKSVVSGTSQTYTAVVKNNGVVVDETVTWKFDNKEIATLTMTAFDTKACTIACSAFAYGIGYLDVFLDKNIAITTYKSITASR